MSDLSILISVYMMCDRVVLSIKWTHGWLSE